MDTQEYAAKVSHWGLHCSSDMTFHEDQSRFSLHAKPEHMALFDFQTGQITRINAWNQTKDRLMTLYESGMIYPVKKSKRLRWFVKVTDITRADVRELSELDAIDEGRISKFDFLKQWCERFDRGITLESFGGGVTITRYRGRDASCIQEFSDFMQSMWRRPDDRYSAWVIQFKYVPNPLQGVDQ